MGELAASRTNAGFLGEGNAFVLGSVGVPELVLIADHAMRLVEMWFWLVAASFYALRESTNKHDQTFPSAYRAVSDAAPEVMEWLRGQYNRQLAIAQGRPTT